MSEPETIPVSDPPPLLPPAQEVHRLQMVLAVVEETALYILKELQFRYHAVRPWLATQLNDIVELSRQRFSGSQN